MKRSQMDRNEQARKAWKIKMAILPIPIPMFIYQRKKKSNLKVSMKEVRSFMLKLSSNSYFNVIVYHQEETLLSTYWQSQLKEKLWFKTWC